MTDVVRRLADLAQALGDPADALGVRARAAVCADGGLSPAMADRVLRRTCDRYTLAALRGCRRDLAGATVGVLLAASVPTAPLRALALPLLRGAAGVLVRPSRRQPRVAALLVEALALPGVQRVAELPAAGLDHLVAYGSDATLAAVAAGAAGGMRFEGHGHGFGAAVVTAGADPEAAAAALAFDVADYDQRGCLSPQVVFVRGDAVAFAAALAAALAALERALPRGALGAGEAARVMQWQGAMAAQSAAFFRGRTHAVAALPAARMASSPGARNVAVVPVASAGEVAALLAPHARHLTCVGVAGAPDAGLVPAGASPRVVAAGTMQDPPLDGPEDPRPP